MATLAPRLTVYGAQWCPDCRRAKKFLGEQLVPYDWVDIEANPRAEQYVRQVNKGKRIIPTIVFADGGVLAWSSPPTPSWPQSSVSARRRGASTTT